MKRHGIVLSACFIILACAAGAPHAWAIDAAVKPTLQADQTLVRKLSGIRALNSPQGVTSLTSAVYGDLKSSVAERKLPVVEAVRRQRDALLVHPDVAEVRELMGSNLFVRFKDNNELLMIMGAGIRGGVQDGPALLALDAPSPVGLSPLQQKASAPSLSNLTPGLIPFIAPRYSCTSNRALIFDCLADGRNVVYPSLSSVAKAHLQAMGYVVDVYANNDADLAMAARIDDGRYGVVLMNGHGGNLGNDFAFLVRPWFGSYPPQNTQFAGTIRSCAYRESPGSQNSLQYCYAFTGTFASTYWQDCRFPGTTFLFDCCHGGDPGLLPGMPTWVLNHGAKAWLGWNGAVFGYCSDRGAVLFFDRQKTGSSLGQGVSSVYAMNCRPPELIMYTAGIDLNDSRLAFWHPDTDEPVSNDRDFKALNAFTEENLLYATVLFHGVPTLSEFLLHIDTNGDGVSEFLARCGRNSYAVYKQGSPGVYDQRVMAKNPAREAESYMICIPWDLLGVSSARIHLYDEVGRDRLPDAMNAYVEVKRY
jgi:hypothetical protein